MWIELIFNFLRIVYIIISCFFPPRLSIPRKYPTYAAYMEIAEKHLNGDFIEKWRRFQIIVNT